MAILKWKTLSGWVELYADALRNRLRRDKNLADLTDRSAARTNLELVGDVATHHHDSHYLPLIQSVKDEVLNAVDQEAADRSAEIQRLKTQMQITDTTTANSINALTTALNATKAQFHVGTTPPISPVNGQTIWFYTSYTEPAIRFYYNNQWITFGSRYL